MTELILLVAIFFLGGWIFGIAGFARAGAARREAERLRGEVAALRAEVGGMAGALIAAGFRPPEAAPHPYAAPPEAYGQGAYAAPPPAAETNAMAPEGAAAAAPGPPPRQRRRRAHRPPGRALPGNGPVLASRNSSPSAGASGSAPGRCCWPASSWCASRWRKAGSAPPPAAALARCLARR